MRIEVLFFCLGAGVALFSYLYSEHFMRGGGGNTHPFVNMFHGLVIGGGTIVGGLLLAASLVLSINAYLKRDASFLTGVTLGTSLVAIVWLFLELGRH